MRSIATIVATMRTTDTAICHAGTPPYATRASITIGRYLFTVNTGSTTISSYRIRDNGSLRYLTSTPFSSGLGIRPFDARLDVGGHYLYVVDAAIASISGFAVSGGSLTELTSSPTALPTGATPFGIAIVAS